MVFCVEHESVYKKKYSEPYIVAEKIDFKNSKMADLRQIEHRKVE